MGLIASGLHRTAVGMLRNMLTLVDTYGFVPNGSRTYYTHRRQGACSCAGLCMPALSGKQWPTGQWPVSSADKHERLD